MIKIVDLSKIISILPKIDLINDYIIPKKNIPKKIDIIPISSITGKNLEKAIQSIAYLIAD